MNYVLLIEYGCDQELFFKSKMISASGYWLKPNAL